MTTTYIIKLASLKAIADIDLAELRATIRRDQQDVFTALEVHSNTFDVDYSASLGRHFSDALTALEEQQSKFHKRIGLGSEGMREIVGSYIDGENDKVEAAKLVSDQLEKFRHPGIKQDEGEPGDG